jgi:hypothetical protein
MADDRMTGTLIDWLKEYPGDLCDPEATRLFKSILALVGDHFFMAHLTVELIMIEDGIPIYVDIDTSWSCKLVESTSRQSISLSHELLVDGLYDLDAILSPTDIDTGTPIKSNHLSRSTGSLLIDDEASVIMERRISNTDSRSDKRSTGTGAGSVSGSGSLSTDSSPGQWTTAVNWVMNNDPLQFAAELTRMQWDLFLTIRVSLYRWCQV